MEIYMIILFSTLHSSIDKAVRMCYVEISTTQHWCCVVTHLRVQAARAPTSKKSKNWVYCLALETLRNGGIPTKLSYIWHCFQLYINARESFCLKFHLVLHPILLFKPISKLSLLFGSLDALGSRGVLLDYSTAWSTYPNTEITLSVIYLG